MRHNAILRSAWLGVLLCGALLSDSRTGLAQPGQSFAGSAETSGAEGSAAALSTPEGSLYADGTRTINEGRWAEAEAIFSKVAAEHGGRADGALYWKAYAENKQGQGKAAMETCAELGHAYASSSWIHECGALEIEIRAKAGKPVDPSTTRDDDLKLLALNSLMQKDESKALAQIQEILNGDSSEKLKKEALFILGQHYSDATFAQIVRISYVEGDVRIARGEEKEKPAGAAWEKAVANLPLETGFSLTTGDGRAEIEFEDASTLYLGENSVLTFNDLHTTSGVPYTELALLAGTVSVDLHPSIAREVFAMNTPTERFIWSYPRQANGRISSYLDGSAVTMLHGGVLQSPEGGREEVTGAQTVFLREGRRIDSAGLGDPGAFADWDKWVADRTAQRAAAMAEMMKASGLTTPIPGLADMKGQGRFFECAPYGTCWEPNGAEQDEEKVSRNRQSSGQGPGQERVQRSGQAGAGPGAHFVQASLSQPARFGAQAMQVGALYPLSANDDLYFPCFPESLRYRLLRDPVTGASRVVNTGLGLYPRSWGWAVCHAGSWVHHRRHYRWVVGRKRHHIAPVRWVKNDHKVAFVPLHPFDVKGRPAINRKEEVFEVNNKNGLTVQRVKFEGSVEELKSPPREFRNTYLPPLSRTEAPHMEAHTIRNGFRAGNYTAVKIAGVPLGFDAKTRSFTMAKEVIHGSRSSTVSVPMTNRSGTLQARGDSFTGGHGGSTSAGGSRGGGTSGGGSRGGGGSSGGSGAGSSGGASHGGGGTSSGGSSSGGSSGGNHH
jgi:hypothetical protein